MSDNLWFAETEGDTIESYMEQGYSAAEAVKKAEEDLKDINPWTK